MSGALNLFQGIGAASFSLFHEMSPYLLFGLMVAALLHRFLSVETVATHLGKGSFVSVLKSVLFGIPLPLCSCSVIPAAVLLKQKGASKGSVISFFIATPITGIDSIFATYSLLGLFFTLFRVLAATLTSLIAGLLANFILTPSSSPVQNVSANESESTPDRSFRQVVAFAIHKLLGEIWKPLLIGTLLGGAITYLVPEQFIETYLGTNWLSMVIMLAVGVPMYVCATGSIPIAAALLMKGMAPGAALVFLLAGPATNAVTIAVVTRELGKNAAILYVSTISVLSLVFGALLNFLWESTEIDLSATMSGDMLPALIMNLSTFTLAALILYNVLRIQWRKRARNVAANK